MTYEEAKDIIDSIGFRDYKFSIKPDLFYPFHKGDDSSIQLSIHINESEYVTVVVFLKNLSKESLIHICFKWVNKIARMEVERSFKVNGIAQFLRS